MRALLIGILVILALIMVMAVVAWNFWGIWGLLGAFAAVIFLVFVLKKLAGKLLLMAFTAPFKMKGEVLHGAVVTVHDVAASEMPDRSFEDEEEDEDDPDMFDSPDEAEEYQRELAEERREQEDIDSHRRWFLLDVTITPQEANCEGFTLWEPDELLIVSPESEPETDFRTDDEEEEIGEVCDMLIWNPELREFGEDEMGKYRGPQRLRMHVGVDPGHDRLAFRYYFEQFGDVKLG